MSLRLRMAVAFLSLIAAVPVTAAGTFELAWDAVSGASGYRVHYGTAPGNYTAVHDAGPRTSTTLEGLEDCTQYYVAVKAYNDAGESALFSSELSGWARPEIVAIDPAVARQGDLFTMNVWGANFKAGAEVDWSATAVPVDSLGTSLVRFDAVEVMSCNLIQALVSIESPVGGQRAMATGELPVAVEVVNPDSVFGTATRTLDIRFNAIRADINRSDESTRDRIDGRDLAWLAYAYGTIDGGDRYNPDADLDGDGVVDGDDLALLAPRFGRCWNGMAWTTGCP